MRRRGKGEGGRLWSSACLCAGGGPKKGRLLSTATGPHGRDEDHIVRVGNVPPLVGFADAGFLLEGPQALHQRDVAEPWGDLFGPALLDVLALRVCARMVV